MKPIFFTLPVGVLFAGAGIWMIAGASRATPLTASPNSGTDPLHPVTPAMTKATNAMAKKNAPNFTLSDATGKTWNLSDLTNGKPLYMYFIMDGCPCSTDAEPLFHALYDQYKGKVNFVGVIGSDSKTAAKWATEHSMPYTILADPTLKVVHAYKAKQAVYNVLVTSDHKIEWMWPGYSQDLLKEMNSRLSKATGLPEKPFDPLYAPLKKTSGCYFPGGP